MQFLERFKPQLIVESPGRINIIGEHTDYNLGYVLPTAIAKKIIFKFQKNDSDHLCNVYTIGYNTGFTVNLNDLSPSATEWENYILGVLHEIGKRTNKVTGFNCTIESNLPTGSGLSSSAALECGLAYGLNTLFELGLDNIAMIQLSQTAEHTYVGTQCGIMDQFASVMSEEGNVILLDCKSLAHEYIPIQIAPYKILMLNTKVSHNLATSEYNVRKEECEKAVNLIQKKYPSIASLRDVNREMLDASREGMGVKVYNRASFIIDENKRVLQTVEALKNNNLEKVGALLYEAHEGISKLYEVSCPESDFLVNFTKTDNAILGARQTGGGFGGCTLNIIHEDAITDFVVRISKAYKAEFSIDLEAFEVAPSGGTSVKQIS